MGPARGGSCAGCERRAAIRSTPLRRPGSTTVASQRRGGTGGGPTAYRRGEERPQRRRPPGGVDLLQDQLRLGKRTAGTDSQDRRPLWTRRTGVPVSGYMTPARCLWHGFRASRRISCQQGPVFRTSRLRRRRGCRQPLHRMFHGRCDDRAVPWQVAGRTVARCVGSGFWSWPGPWPQTSTRPAAWPLASSLLAPACPPCGMPPSATVVASPPPYRWN